jgi:hypothetical protein
VVKKKYTLTSGAVKARHIRDAVVDCLGDINVATEKHETRIEEVKTTDAHAEEEWAMIASAL